ncbi:MAG: hypothetical protein KDD38_03840 [Bdellovibrionales bacterium]|nr:hypothetical protein [Bdellovibrionales bacterium]
MKTLKKQYFKIRILLILATHLVATPLIAGERFEFFNGVRSLGMGGVSAAVVNDETALLANPAALGKLRNYFVTVADPEVDVSADAERIVGTGILKFLDPQQTLDAVEAFPGKRLHERVQVFPSFVVTNFGMGVFAKYVTDASVDATSTTFTYDYTNDLAFVFGFNFRLFDGKIKLGVNGRAVNRVESHRTDIPVATNGLTHTTVIGSGTIANEGLGVASDVGLILTGPWAFLPTIAFVYHDVGNTTYDVNNGMFLSTTDRPDPTPATLDVGLGIFPITGKGSRIAFSLEMVDVLDAKEPADEEASDEVMRRLHGGIEFNFKDVFFLRGGMNQGYWTAGMELSMYNTQLQIATYGEEVGDIVPAGSAATYTAVEDRRYVVKFAYRF